MKSDVGGLGGCVGENKTQKNSWLKLSQMRFEAFKLKSFMPPEWRKWMAELGFKKTLIKHLRVKKN